MLRREGVRDDVELQIPGNAHDRLTLMLGIGGLLAVRFGADEMASSVLVARAVSGIVYVWAAMNRQWLTRLRVIYAR